MRKFFACIPLFCFLDTAFIHAQVPFSQLYASPMQLNPALTGRFNKSYRIGGAYRREATGRNQLFARALFSGETKLLASRLPERDCLGIGFSALSERNGNDGIRNTTVSISAAYHKGVDETGRQQLAVGFRASYANRQLTRPDYIFEDRLVSWLNAGYSIYDISTLTNTTVTYTDLDAGILYQGLFDPRNYFSLGISMYHITSPRKLFPGGELQVPRETRVHAAWERRGHNNSLVTHALVNYAQSSVADLFASSVLQINLNRICQLCLGAGYRSNPVSGNVIVPLAGLSFSGFTLRVSYDISVFSRKTQQRSAAELSLVFTAARSRDAFDEDRFIRF